ncbi:MAG: hypothetical protein EFT35_04745 [Methanophagales archaeon ANME-1-THS]|nr:MAG: hypothetical protein EFT35_04745 [Methanophagales archaeon ANME-1-THS]
MLLLALVWIHEEVMRIGNKAVRLVYLAEPLSEADIQELEYAFNRLIAQLPFYLTKELRRRLEKIEWIVRADEKLRVVADEIKRYKETLRGDDVRLTIGERIALLQQLERWRRTIKERVGFPERGS